MIQSTERRTWRTLAVALVLCAGLAVTAAPAQALPAVAYRTNGDAAIAWLAEQQRAAASSGWARGTWADVVLAHAVSDGDRSLAFAALGKLTEGDFAAWVAPGGTTDPGRAAKALLAAATLNADHHRLGGVDVQQALTATMQPSGADAGRFGAATTFVQSLAILALSRAGDGAPAAASTWLVGRQCADGGFSPVLSCASADADHTALGAQALAAAGRTTEAARAADWLGGRQAVDGGFGDGSNANSTALATQALRALGRSAPAGNGAERVRTLQKAGGADAGAIAFRSDADGDLVLATTQGVLAWGAPRLDRIGFPDVIGTPCPTADGVTVVVDLALFDGSVRVGCSTQASPTGLEALQTAGFAVTLHPSFAAVCTIEGEPSPATEGCFERGFWSYWNAAPGADWMAYQVGPDQSRPAPGTVEGWRYDPSFATGAFAPRAATRWPSVSVSGPTAATTGVPTSYEATVSYAGAPVTDGVVQLLRDGQPLGGRRSLDGNGRAQLPVTFGEPGNATITARYLGPSANPRTSAQSIGVSIAVGPGYWLVASDGGVFAFGGIGFHGSQGATRLAQPIVAAAATPSGRGYWLTASDGGVFAHGDAVFHGSLGALKLNRPIVGMVATPSGGGYWLVASDGGVFAFGDAVFHGSTGAIKLVSPIVGMISSPSGGGYLLAAADGGVFAFGDARFAGSMGDRRLVKPIVAIIAEPGQPGYILVAADGGVFALGGAPFRGSRGGQPLVRPIVAASAVPGGYRFVASDGGVFSYGVPFFGSTGGIKLVQPIVAFAVH